MLGEVVCAVDAAAQDATAKVLVLTGAGKAFCAGVDVADHTADRVRHALPLFHQAIRTLRAAPMPVVAAINGAALGGGFELALACDLVVASDRARVGQPEIALGVFPPVAAVMLPRLTGMQRALDLVLTGRTLTAAEAYVMGLVTRVFPAEHFADELTALIDRMTSLSGPVLRMAKQAVRAGTEADVDPALERVERLYLDELMQLRDAHEGIAAFMEKRQPVWSEA
jgi:cyclohexa-1,5-dienecarbonyl-CoA hydratase